MNPLSLAESQRKSSRSKADLFELLLTSELRDYYGMTTTIQKKELKKLESEISKFLNGNRRTEEQRQRVNILSSPLVNKIHDELISKYGPPVDVQWVGRSWQSKESLSDIDIKFKSGNIVGISLKSTRSGSGTQKNLGEATLKKYLSLDLSKEIEGMWRTMCRELGELEGELAKISQAGRTIIRENKYKFPIIQKLGKKHGSPVQKLAVSQSVELFNNLPRDKKLDFLEHILGIEESKPLLNAGVKGKEPYLFWNERFNKLLTGEIKAVSEDGSKGYHVIVDSDKIIRIQANFTNGIGLSAFCERAFLPANLF